MCHSRLGSKEFLFLCTVCEYTCVCLLSYLTVITLLYLFGVPSVEWMADFLTLLCPHAALLMAWPTLAWYGLAWFGFTHQTPLVERPSLLPLQLPLVLSWWQVMYLPMHDTPTMHNTRTRHDPFTLYARHITVIINWMVQNLNADWLKAVLSDRMTKHLFLLF